MGYAIETTLHIVAIRSVSEHAGRLEQG